MGSTSLSQPQDSQKPARRITWQVDAKTLGSFFMMPIVLFVTAGRFAWGWEVVLLNN